MVPGRALMATHSNGISALHAQGRLGIGSYKSAWLMLQKLLRRRRTRTGRFCRGSRRSTRRRFGAGSEGQRPQREGEDLPGRGRGTLRERESRRIRLEKTGSYGGERLRPFSAGTVEPGARVVTDGWSGHSGLLPDSPRDAHVVGDRKAHEVLK